MFCADAERLKYFVVIVPGELFIKSDPPTHNFLFLNYWTD